MRSARRSSRPCGRGCAPSRSADRHLRRAGAGTRQRGASGGARERPQPDLDHRPLPPGGRRERPPDRLRRRHTDQAGPARSTKAGSPGGYRGRPASCPNGAWRRGRRRSAGRPARCATRSLRPQPKAAKAQDPHMILLSGTESARWWPRSIGTFKVIGRREGKLKSLCWPTCKQAAATWSEPPRRSRPAYPSRWASSPGSPTTTAGPGTRTAPPSSATLDPERWERVAENPVKLLQEARPPACRAAAQNAELLARAAALEERVTRRPEPPTHDGPATTDRPIAYFSAEYGFHGSFPIYSGGLGALAGDILKEASDRAWPLAAVGPAVPQRLLPPAHRRPRLAARVLGRHRPGPPARGARDR